MLELICVGTFTLNKKMIIKALYTVINNILQFWTPYPNFVDVISYMREYVLTQATRSPNISILISKFSELRHFNHKMLATE